MTSIPYNMLTATFPREYQAPRMAFCLFPGLSGLSGLTGLSPIMGGAAGAGPIGDALLKEGVDYLLLETADYLLLE